MKLRNKILIALAPAATIAATLPIAMTSCSKVADIETWSESTHKLDDSYSTAKLYFNLANKFWFTEAEKTGKTIRFTMNNLKYNDKVKVESGQKLILQYSQMSWALDVATQKYSTATTYIYVKNCDLETGAEITFDLIGQFGTASGETFTGISSEVNFGNWKFTY